MTVMGTPQQRPPQPTARAMVAVPGLLPYRPKSTSRKELGFRRRPAVHWLQPLMLAGTAVQVLLSSFFGEFLDKRELQTTLPDTVFHEGDVDNPEGELWFDYVADLGDGFNATYTMAYLIAQEELKIEGQPQSLPRGRFLVMGGDEVYPTPSSTVYNDKTAGPYRAALPAQPPTGLIPLYALPGNHDWYDGLSSFMRLFIKHGEDTLGGWCNAQSRSYFAIQLPQRWWLFAIDTQLGDYLDQPQLQYFAKAVANLQDGDKIILCTPTPGWVEAEYDDGAYNAINFFVRFVRQQLDRAGRQGVDFKLMLSGDLHHYAHYHTDTAVGPRELIHCGGGGAYLYPTHKMPATIQVPPKPKNPHLVSTEPAKTYTRRETFPSIGRSVRDAFGVLWRAPLRNWGFVVLLGALQLLLAVALLGGVIGHTSELTHKWITLPIVALGLTVFLGTIGFANLSTGGSGNRLLRLGFGIVHGCAQLALGYWGAHLLYRVPALHGDWPEPIGVGVGYLVAAGIASALIFCVYLLIASTFRINLNELFSSQSLIDTKSFLRIHIDSTGKLTVHAIGVRRVSRRWKANPDGQVHEPWLEPKGNLKRQLCLIEKIEVS